MGASSKEQKLIQNF